MYLFSYPATGAVTCAVRRAHSQLRVASDRYPHNALDRSVANGIRRSAKSMHVCGGLQIFRGGAALSTRRRRRAASLFISSKKRKGARKTFTCAIYARGARTQRYSED